jgi:hypothetical protein
MSGKPIDKAHNGFEYKEVRTYMRYRDKTKKLQQIKIIFSDLKLPYFAFVGKKKTFTFKSLLRTRHDIADTHFAGLVSVYSDNEHVFRIVKEDAKLRSLLCNLFSLPKSSCFLWPEVTAGNEGIEFSFRVKVNAGENVVQSELESKLSSLFSICEALRSLTELPREERKNTKAGIVHFSSKALFFVLFVAIFQAFIPLKHHWIIFPPLLPFWIFILGLSAIIWGALQLLVFAFFRNSCHLGRLLIRTLIAGAFVLPLFTLSMVFFLNIALDVHPPKKLETCVVGRYTEEHSRGGPAYYVQFQQKNNDFGRVIELSMPVQDYAQMRIWTSVDFWIKPGYFGFPWLLAMNPEPEAESRY